MVYKARLVDQVLKKYLQAMGAVLIEGPKGCGKTTTGEQVAKSTLYLGSSRTREETLERLGYSPASVLSGAAPKLIDEWQVIPQLWDDVRFEVDHRQKPGQFVLTGSALPADRSEILHTGTGRFAWLKMRTMSLFESGDSNGAVSLKALFEGENDVVGDNPLPIDRIAFLTCRGGWPQTLNQSDDIALTLAYQYLEAIVNTDVSRVDDVKRAPEKVRQFLGSYARNVGSQTAMTDIRNDIVKGMAEESFNERTCYSYAEALQKIFVIEETKAWNPNLRSKTAIRTSDTRYFTDPAIGAAALRIGPQDLLNDPKTFGFLFENLCIRDIRVYADVLDGDVFHYRDKNGLECDAVLHRRNGTYGLIEIKLGGQYAIDHGAETLHALAEKINTKQMAHPSFLMVLVGAGNSAYKRRDGVWVVPIGCLKP